jgi:hypothetical protein
VADKGVVGHGRTDGPGGHKGGGGNEPVHGNGQAAGGRAEDQAGQTGDLKPAQGGQDGYGIAPGNGGGMQRKGLGHHGGLAPHASGVQTGAGPGDIGRIKPQIGAKKGRGRRGVGNAHIARAQGGHTLGSGGLGQGDAQEQGLLAGLPAHGRAGGQIGRARGHAPPGKARMGREGLTQAAGVHHPQVNAGGCGQDVDAGPAGQEIGDHLPGDFLGKQAHALGRHAMVSGAHINAGRIDPGRPAAA